MNHGQAAKFREHLKKAYGLDITQSPMQLNELVVNCKAKIEKFSESLL
jgi:hypothetical protein